MTNNWRRRALRRDPERTRAILKAQRQRYWAKNGKARNRARKLGISTAEARRELEKKDD